MTEGDEAFAEVIDKLVHAGNDAAEIRNALQMAIAKMPDSQLTTFFPADEGGVWAAPTREHTYDAGIDLRISRGVRLEPGASASVPTGTSVSIPQGYFGLLAIRSGLGAKGVTLLNGVGIIDHGYEGSIGLILANFGTDEWQAAPGERIAQLIIVPCSTGPISFTSMAQPQTPKSDRGDGGFGSSGTD